MSDPLSDFFRSTGAGLSDADVPPSRFARAERAVERDLFAASRKAVLVRAARAREKAAAR